MKTLRIAIDPEDLDSEASRAAIETAAAILRCGGLVAFPTETVYGLGANALSADAVEKIFIAKRRPAWDPLIVHISPEKMMAGLAKLPANGPARQLMNAFWPGPLTLLLPKTEQVPDIVTAGRPLVGVRMPAHPVARALIASAGVPIAAPSANSFGRISPTLAAHVLEDLDGRIDAVLDGGETTHGLESTVVDASREPVVVYRPGMLSLEKIREVCGSAVQCIADASASGGETSPESMPSPGIALRHYAPRARLVLVDDDPVGQPTSFRQTVREAIENPGEELALIGVMLPTNFLTSALPDFGRRALVFDWGDWRDLEQLAHRLFAGLRALDAMGAEVIVCPLPPPYGIGVAIRDRLLKAAKVK